MRPAHRIPSQRGLTLVELMVAMVLSLVLIAGASSIFLGGKRSFKVQEESARIQENIRYIVNRMITDLSSAGFCGCAPSAQEGKSRINSTVKSQNNDILYDFSHAISGVEGGANKPDSITARFALPEVSLPVIAPMTPQDSAVRVDSNHPLYGDIEAGDIITVSDCGLIAAFMVTEAKANGHLEHRPGVAINGITNSKTEITHYFGSGLYSSATAIKMDAITYELRRTTRGEGADKTTVSALYAKRLGGKAQEILSGVEDLQIHYGIDDADPPDGTSDRYVDWSIVADNQLEERIASIRIALTLNAGEPLPAGGDTDGITRENIEFVVKLRNRLADL